MRKNRSPYSNAKYPNLYRMPGKPAWVFRKYSSEKRKEFYCSTGLEATDRTAPAAYKVGLEKFNVWMGAFVSTDRQSTMREIARAVLAAKDDPTISDATLRAVRNQIENHIIPACGHMRPSQITTEWWTNYQRDARKRPREILLKDGTARELPPRTKLFNTRKALREILRFAKGRGLIDEIPELPLNDADPAPPRFIPKETILRIIRYAGRIAGYERGEVQVPESRRRAVPLKLLVFIMWKQGARPSEVLQYRWTMFRWGEGTYGMLEIPAEITKTRRARSIPLHKKVSRVLRFLEPHSKNDWIFPSPTTPGDRVRDYSSAWDSTMRRLGLDYDIYNLRDTHISERLTAGKNAVFIGRYVDNSAAIIDRKYAVATRSILEDVLSDGKKPVPKRGEKALRSDADD